MSSSSGPYPIRTIQPPEVPAFHEVNHIGFNSAWPVEPEVERATRLLEVDRSLAAFDGPLMIGTTTTLPLRMTVPGASLPVAGVSDVSVLPSHRRRGVLSALMRTQLEELRAGGETVAALWASEAVIYGRFGYGPAARQLDFTAVRGEVRVRDDAPRDPALRVRIADPATARPEVAKVFDATLAERPGRFARGEALWELALLYDPPYRREGAAPLRCVIVEDESGPRGYALVSVHGTWTVENLPDGRLRVRDMAALDTAAYVAVWEQVLSWDLVSTVTIGHRPPDDPLLHLVTDPRRLRATSSDNLWVRLVDVPAAFAARRYAVPVDAVIEVDDPVCPWNAGRYRLRGGAAGAECSPTSAPADVRADAGALGAAYLGGTTLMSYGPTGRVTELRPGTLAPLSAGLRWSPEPCCPTIF
ncbi:MAG: GNAT family N-acetyltransferase [Streptosporangiales bacterium]|nr:GNAT family N-acetyltransferase [Streptosporangiales bacterium]